MSTLTLPEVASAADRAALAAYLQETMLRAAGAAPGHPVVITLGHLAAAVEAGLKVAALRLAQPEREQLHAVVLAAWQRARGEAPEVEPVVRRLLAEVERATYGPGGWRPPPPPPDDHPGWSSDQLIRLR